MRIRLLVLLAGILWTGCASAQKPPVNGVAGPSTSANFFSITTDPRGSGGLTFGGATVQGSLVAGNAAIINDSGQGIKDSGVQLLTTLCAGCVASNISSSTGPVVVQPFLNLGPGSLGAPTFSSYQDPTSGLWFSVSGRADIQTGGKNLISFGTVGATGNSLLVSANNTPTITAVGTTVLQLSGGTSNGVDLMNGGASTFLQRLARSGTNANYNYFRVLAVDTGNAVQLQTVAAGASPDSAPSLNVVPGGTGTFQYKGTEIATLGANTFAGTQTFATSSTGAGTQTFANSPCSGLTSERWIPVGITGQTGTWYIPACQ